MSTFVQSTSNCFPFNFLHLRILQELDLVSTNFDCSSVKNRVTSIVLKIANYGLFRTVRIDLSVENPKNFMKIKFRNKAVDAIKITSLLRLTSVINP